MKIHPVTGSDEMKEGFSILQKDYMKPYQLLIADNHQVIINGLTEMLSNEEQFEICGSVLRYEELIPSLHLKKPQLLLLDVNMQDNNTLKIIPEIQSLFPSLKIIAFTSYDTPTFRREAARFGVTFLTKESSKEKIKRTIFQAFMGENTLSASCRTTNHKEELAFIDKFVINGILTKREVEVLILVAQGNTSQQIAEALFVSKHTVKWHRKNIIAKLNFNSVGDMVRFALDNGLV